MSNQNIDGNRTVSMLNLSQHDGTLGVKQLLCSGLHTEIYAELRSCTFFYEGVFKNCINFNVCQETDNFKNK